ncbi:HesA/MoeB/ThiF family protein [Polluticaenibacter yanchengensis]|uniref:ThiF family adenylyltransferase n=1 Tax=Polluticaenibacter yanchengensis TaxID=3014562 RepID=A0ABT4UPB2_9BACT|nr:ThiF family adenylyltransferase [Chitinophagaceae bacterium LY-5]
MNRLKISGTHYLELKSHLFPGDGLEAVAVAICGRSKFKNNHTLLVQEIIPVPYNICFHRAPDLVHWPTEYINDSIEKASKKGLALVKIHCHPGLYERFSETDDESDDSLFRSIHAWLDDDQPHGSCIMLPDGRIFGRLFQSDMRIENIDEIIVAGSDFKKWSYTATESLLNEDAQIRNLQAFGSLTKKLLNNLQVGVVGCSGTGSPVIEQLVRLGIGTLVIVDPDYIDLVNLNRIIGSTMRDAECKVAKVRSIREHIGRVGIGTKVISIEESILGENAIKQLAECDIIFGCVDTTEGRYYLNKLSSYYLIPLFDLGVRFEADGNGGINSLNATVHYVQPHRSSLLNRKAINLEKLRSEGIKRLDKEEYERNTYLAEVGETNPAVISVNMQVASTAVNDFLARVHPYRNICNSEIETIRVMISDCSTFYEDGIVEQCPLFSKQTGRGDVFPLLDIIELSQNAKTNI